MRVTFVAMGCEQLGVTMLANIARQKGHQVQLAYSAALFHDRYNLNIPWLGRIFDDSDHVVDQIVAQRPDVIACSSLTATHRRLSEMSARAKKRLPHAKVVFGGVHPSAVPERVLSEAHIDFVCVGEGDQSFPAILRAIEQDNLEEPIANVRHISPSGHLLTGAQVGFIQDLDSLPGYDKSLWEDHMRFDALYMTMVGRGCPFRCTFCFNNFFAELPEGRSGKYVRLRSVDHVMNELLHAKRRYNFRFVSFEDDIFNVDKRWLKPFLERYKREIGVPFQCLTHPRYMDDECARWMADAGCEWVQMGVQSADTEFRNQELRRHEKSNPIERALAAMSKHGLKVKLDHMFGLPGEPIEAQQSALDLYEAHQPNRIQTFWTVYLPGTQMMREALAEGRITQEDADRINDGIDFELYHLSGNRLSEEATSTFSAYQTYFRWLPLLPAWLRRPHPSQLRWLPNGLLEVMGLAADLLNALLTRNPDHSSYLLHYADQLWRLLRRARGGGQSTPPVTTGSDTENPSSPSRPTLPSTVA